MSQHSITLEFFGMPGVGKSTLSKRVAEVLCQKGLPIDHRMYALAHQTSKSKRVVIKSLFIRPTGHFNGIRLCDQGIFQAFWSKCK